MPEKASSATAFLPVVNRVSPASEFQHQGQSSTAGYGLVRYCLAMDLRLVPDQVKINQHLARRGNNSLGVARINLSLGD